jgi:holo-[acyl-carrier protein] synthase
MPLSAPRIGQDLVDVARFRRALEGKEARWSRRVFTAREWAVGRSSADPARTLAVCFAAKEAAFKALGSGWGQGVGWQDVELPEDEGLPLVLSGRAAEIAASLGVVLRASTSHTETLAVAMVLGQPA